MKTGCILWAGYIDVAGYGRAFVDGRPVRAHRLAYEKANGQIPEGLVIRHLCNVKACVNTDHLQAGTQAENVADTASIGMMSRYGKSNPRAKLTSEQVMEIRRLHSDGVPKLSIAIAFEISRRNVSYIVNNKTRVYA